MPTPLPILTYGHNPKPGGITYVDQPDGSVDIYILPRPAWQLWLFAAALAQPMVLLFTYVHFIGSINTAGVVAPRWVFTILIPAMSLLGPTCVLTVLLLSFGRQSCYIHAGPDGLRVHYTEHGDPRRLEVPADQILDVGFVRRHSDGYNCPCLTIRLKGRTHTIPLLRRKANVLKIAAAVRRGLTGRS